MSIPIATYDICKENGRSYAKQCGTQKKHNG